MNKKLKAIFCIIITIVALFSSANIVNAQHVPEDDLQIIESQMDIFGADEIYDSLPGEVKNILSENGFKEINFEAINRMQFTDLLNILWQMILCTLKKPFKIFFITIFLVVLSAIFDSYKDSLSNQNIKGVFGVVAVLCIIAALSLPINNHIVNAKDTVLQSKNFLACFVPAFTGLLTTSGQGLTATAFSAITMGFIQGVAGFLATFIVPMLNIYLALSFAAGINTSFDLIPATEIIRKGVNYTLSFMITIFIGFWSLQNMVTLSADNVAIKTTKLAVASFVPVVGAPLAEAMNSVTSCLSLVKSTTGVFAIFAFILIYLPIIVSACLWLISLNLSSAFAQMLGNNRIATIFKSTGNVFKIIIVIILCFMLMTIISVTVLITAGRG